MPADKREKFMEWFSPTGHNFFGTGLSMKEFMLLGYAERFQRSYGQQDVAEQKRRMHFVMELVRQLDAIRKVTNFATALAEMAIGSVLEGDWAVVKALAQDFVGEDFQGREYTAAYARFGELLSEAATTIPKPGEEGPN